MKHFYCEDWNNTIDKAKEEKEIKSIQFNLLRPHHNITKNKDIPMIEVCALVQEGNQSKTPFRIKKQICFEIPLENLKDAYKVLSKK